MIISIISIIIEVDGFMTFIVMRSQKGELEMASNLRVPCRPMTSGKR